MNAARIVIVEDESIVAQDLRMSLGQLGYEVCAVVASGEEALEEVDRHRPDLVLMDIALAGRLTGIETAEIVRKRSRTPVMYLTAHADDETLSRAGATEPFGFIVKPFETRDLKSGIEIAIYRARIEAERLRAEEALRASENELAIRNRIAQVFLTVPAEKAPGRTLEVVLDATDSPCGLFGHLDASGAMLSHPGARDESLKRRMAEKHPIPVPGRWRGALKRVLSEPQAFCVEGDPDALPGQIPIDRAVCSPIRHGTELLGFLCVANRALPYVERDLRLMSAIAAYVAPILAARLQGDRQLRARRQAEEALKNLRRQLTADESFAGIVGRSGVMAELFDSIRELAQVDAPVLIQGESGTGKELVALAIHSEGPRRDRPFVAVNCGALPETLLESELFGHVRGAFSGAVRDKKGRFELADGGILFLDEVGEISLPMQVRLLRVLQEGTFERLGGEQTIRVDVRVISATNRNLFQLVKAGKFREDLFYRLCVIPVELPPLRKRTEDIPLLAEHTLRQVASQSRREIRSLSSEAIELLMRYPWPGNVRELQNAIHYASVKSKGPVLDVGDLPPAITHPPAALPDGPRPGRKPKCSHLAIRQALAAARGNRAAAARALGITRSTLYRYLQDPKGAE